MNTTTIRSAPAPHAGGATASGYYSHQGDMAQINANASYQAGRYSAVGIGAQAA